jgi:hypothetical protein
MLRESHQKAAELHQTAAHAHLVAAQHGKQDHQSGREESRQALEHSTGAFAASQEAHQKFPRNDREVNASQEVTMLNDAVRVADPINNPQFRAGDEVIITEGPHKDRHGIYLELRDDVEWASIKKSNGTVSSHPVEWMSSYREPLSYFSLTGRNKKVAWTPKLTAPLPPNADTQVSGGSPSDPGATTESIAVPANAKLTKRFTFDVPADLHRRIKACCAKNSVEMADEMRRLLIKEFPEGDGALIQE